MRTAALQISVCLVLSSGLALAQATVPRGTVQDRSWVYDDEAKMGGKMVKSRYTIQEISPTTYTFKWEILGDDGAWQTLMEGKSNKSA